MFQCHVRIYMIIDLYLLISVSFMRYMIFDLYLPHASVFFKKYKTFDLYLLMFSVM